MARPLTRTTALRRALAQAGYPTLRTISQATGYSRSYVDMICRGERRPRDNDGPIQALAKLLDCTPQRVRSMIPHEPPPRRRKTRATVKLDLTRDLYRRVRRLARDTGQDVHELAREALELYMDEIEGAA